MKSIVRILAVASAVLAFGAGADELDDLLSDSGGSADTAEAASGDESSEGESAEGESAEGESAEGESAEGESAEGEGEGEGEDIVPAKKSKAKHFFLLPYCRELDGVGEVCLPGRSEWVPIEEGKYYPLGTTYRTIGPESRLRIVFGNESEVIVRGDSSFGTRMQGVGEKSRALNLISGTILVKLPKNLPESLFTVNAPGFSAYNPAGESRYTYRTTVDGDEAVVRCVTQSLSIKGRHFDIVGMRAANEVRIRTSQDLLFTALYGSRGDVPVRLDQGRVLVKDYGTGASHVEDKTLDWKLSPKTAVRIHRSMPALGEKMSVTAMTFDAAGELKNRCAFTEKTVEVNSGELGPTSKKDREALAKRAADMAEATETEGVAAETTESEAAEEGGSSEEAPAAADSGEDLF